MQAIAFIKSDISYLNKMLLNSDKSIKVLDYQQLVDVPQKHITQFCVENGVYILPTKELISFLKDEIGEMKAIEIGAGNGAIARELNIIATDSFMQKNPEVVMLYQLAMQPVVNYGSNVEKYEALDAIRKFKPQVAIGAYCTHKYNPKEHWRDGNMYGVEEKKLLDKVKKYIHIGNENVHNKKPILSINHREIKPDWLLSRSLEKDKNVIWVWENNTKT